MAIGKVRQVYCSPGGTTKRVVNAIATHFHTPCAEHDLTPCRPPDIAPFAPDEVAIVGIPVFSGRVPEFAADRLEGLTGANAAAIAVVVYGNRDYEDALLELKDILAKRGFSVVAAAACIARHSIFTQVAHDRPDAKDLDDFAGFAARCRAKLSERETSGRECSPLAVKGAYPYRDIQTLHFSPSIDDRCVGCGACVAACPMQALQMPAPGKPPVRDNAACIACIACTACIHACRAGAQAFRDDRLRMMEKVFVEKVRARREPEFFL